MSKIPKEPDPQQLRETAEAKLGRQTLKLVDPRPGEELLHDLLHELGVHQIELEMQNEALRQAQVVIEESRDRYLDLYEFSPVGYLTLTREGMISEANLTAATLLEIDRRKLLQRRFALLVEDADRERWDLFFAGMFQYDGRRHCELSLKRSDKAALHVQLDCMHIKSGGLSSVRITLTDITERKLKDEEVREKEEYFRMIAENTEDFIAVLDLKGKRLYNNSTYTRMFGDAERQDTVSFAEIHPDDREHVKQLFRETVASGNGVRADFRFVLADGSIRQMESRAGVVKDSKGMASRVVVVARDITERKEAEEKIRNLAFYDLLTKLPNRRLMNDRMAQSMAASKRSGRFAAMMFIDLDNFKPLNDRHGHSVGDLLLVEAARRIGNCVREVDTVSRFGGDEFVVLLSELDADKAKSLTEAGIVAEKIRIALAEPYLLATRQDGKAGITVTHHCTSSIGVVLFVNHEISTDEILKRADWAMYQAKNGGRDSTRFFDSSTPMGTG